MGQTNKKLNKVINQNQGCIIHNDIELLNLFRNYKINYIELCTPVVQVTYLLDNYDFFENLFKLDIDQIKKLVYSLSCLVINPKNIKNLQIGDVIEKEKYFEIIRKFGDNSLDVLTGGNALQCLINYYISDENKDYLDALLIYELPIYFESIANPEIDLFEIYKAIIYHNKRIPYMIKNHAPEIIFLNEKQIFQKKFDELTNALLG